MEYAFKLYKRVLDGHLCEVVDIDKMQYEFLPGKGTDDTVFVLRRFKEKFIPKKRHCFLYLLTWKRLLIGIVKLFQGNYSNNFQGKLLALL